jgi:hypothetical protein
VIDTPGLFSLDLEYKDVMIVEVRSQTLRTRRCEVSVCAKWLTERNLNCSAEIRNLAVTALEVIEDDGKSIRVRDHHCKWVGNSVGVKDSPLGVDCTVLNNAGVTTANECVSEYSMKLVSTKKASIVAGVRSFDQEWLPLPVSADEILDRYGSQQVIESWKS